MIGEPAAGPLGGRVGSPLVTVAVVVKVFDGIVLAADSATTLSLSNGSHHVYNNANKIFHLHRRKPVAAMTWGLGNVGSASTATLAKDLRRRLMGLDPAHVDWALQDDWTVEEVAGRLIEMIYDELFAVQYASTPPPSLLGFLVAGYSGREKQAEAWLVEMVDGSTRPVPTLAAGQDASGWDAFAQPEGTKRLFLGYDPTLVDLLKAKNVLSPGEADKLQAFLTQGPFPPLYRNPVVASMPFADAISLARYLVDVTVGYSRYQLGPDTVGGPVEVAGMTRHEGFKWISRKHYYSPDYNPEDPRHDY